MENKHTRRENEVEQRSSVPNDLPDSEKDMQKLSSEETIIDMPEVKDIPGQENVHVPPLGELADTTASSADEEGLGILDELNGGEGDRYRTTGEGSLTRGETAALRNDDYMPTRDEDNLYRATMDNTDFDNEPLNEKGFGTERTGSDLDVPGSEDDNVSEKSGAEDEENNSYSLGSERGEANKTRS